MWRDRRGLNRFVRCIGVSIKPLISLLRVFSPSLHGSSEQPRILYRLESQERVNQPVLAVARFSLLVECRSPQSLRHKLGWGEERGGRGLRVGVWKEGCRPRNGREVKAREWRKKTDGRKCLSGLHGWLNDGMAGMCQTKLVRRVL